MLHNAHQRRLLAAAVATAALAATAPAAPAMPIDNGRTVSPAAPERVKVVRVQVDEGLDWADAGIGAAGTLALVLAGYGALATVPRRQRSAVHS